MFTWNPPDLNVGEEVKSVMRDFLIPFITVLIGNWINMIMDRACPMK